MNPTHPFRQRFVLPALVFTCVWSVAAGAADKALPRATPESQGVSSAAIRAYVEAADTGIDTIYRPGRARSSS